MIKALKGSEVVVGFIASSLFKISRNCLAALVFSYLKTF